LETPWTASDEQKERGQANTLVACKVFQQSQK
jgi:hypothetical protein